MDLLWADSHRDLHGFEQIFFPAENPSFLKYIQYFCDLWIFLQEKIFHSKLRSTPKREIFLQDKIKSHGKAGAYRGFLTQYCRNRSVLERITPCVRPPLGELLCVIGEGSRCSDPQGLQYPARCRGRCAATCRSGRGSPFWNCT